MRPTIRDVAARAGVSAMAVSVVLNGAGRNVTISEEKAERIRRAAKELRYQKNQMAKVFRSQRTRQVAVVFQHLGRLGREHPYHTDVLNGVMEALFPHDYSMSLCPKMFRGGDACLDEDGRFDGILWCRPDFREVSLDLLRQSSLPVVMMHVPPGFVPGLPTFCADNDAAMSRVVDHLQSLGHERLVFVIDPWSIQLAEGQTRSEALVSAAIRAGLPKPDVLVLESDHSILSRYSKRNAPHTALVCFSDELAGNVLKSCSRLEVRVPGDISVVGFDSSPFCDTTRPRLTSVNQPVEKIAFGATTHLLSLIRAADEGSAKSPMAACIYDCGLDIRESTGRVRAD